MDVAAGAECASVCAYRPHTRAGGGNPGSGRGIDYAAVAGACLAGSSGHLWVEEMEDGMGSQLDGGYRVQRLGFRVQGLGPC